MTEERLAGLRSLLAREGVDGLLVRGAANRRYISGFTGSAGTLLITAGEAVLSTDFRYLEQAGEQAPGWRVVRTASEEERTLGEVVRELGLGRLAFEADHTSCAARDRLERALTGVELVPVQGWVEQQRRVKDAAEQASIRRAAAVADAVVGQLPRFVRTGQPEERITAEVEYRLRLAGGQERSFPCIAAAGPRGALPHATPTERVWSSGEFLVLDFGAVVDGYCSDITRTVAAGDPPEELRRVHAAVLGAQKAAREGIRPGLTGAQVDALARRYLTEAGYGEAFGHGLGHGVGLEVHEGPVLSPTSRDLLAPGMVVTLEPGVYLPGLGGVRVEDMVLVTEEGCEVLTRSPRELVCLSATHG